MKPGTRRKSPVPGFFYFPEIVMASRLISDCVPELQDKFKAFAVKMAEAGVPFMLTCTYRSQAEQDALGAQHGVRLWLWQFQTTFQFCHTICKDLITAGTSLHCFCFGAQR